MRTSTRISPRLGRLAGAAAILFIPLATLLVVLATRVGDATGAAATQPATMGVSGDTLTALRWVVAAGLVAAASVIGVTLARRR